MQIYIVGATGLVGNEILKLLENYRFQDINFIASSQSAGKEITFKDSKFIIKDFDSITDFSNSIFINCSSSKLGTDIYNKISNKSILIDNSSALRLKKEVPLVVPHINFPEIKSSVFANPNCSTIILACLLNPLKDFGLERIVVSTYQAASGAGKEGLLELELQTKQYANNEDLTTDFWGKQYVNNCFVHNSPLSEELYNTEEMKLINETRKIFNIPDLKITATCIRVPTIRSHCESVNIQFKNEINYEQIKELLGQDPNVVLVDDKKDSNFPDTICSTNKNEVYIGHIRPDFSLPKNKGWNFWISGDQILRGAAYNAVKILEKVMD